MLTEQSHLPTQQVNYELLSLTFWRINLFSLQPIWKTINRKFHFVSVAMLEVNTYNIYGRLLSWRNYKVVMMCLAETRDEVVVA
jgi:hypothetical protein